MRYKGRQFSMMKLEISEEFYTCGYTCQECGERLEGDTFPTEAPITTPNGVYTYKLTKGHVWMTVANIPKDLWIPYHLDPNAQEVEGSIGGLEDKLSGGDGV